MGLCLQFHWMKNNQQYNIRTEHQLNRWAQKYVQIAALHKTKPSHFTPYVIHDENEFTDHHKSEFVHALPKRSDLLVFLFCILPFVVVFYANILTQFYTHQFISFVCSYILSHGRWRMRKSHADIFYIQNYFRCVLPHKGIHRKQTQFRDMQAKHTIL